MRAILKNGKTVTGRLAEVLVSCHVATKEGEAVMPIKKDVVFEEKQSAKHTEKAKTKTKGRPAKFKR